MRSPTKNVKQGWRYGLRLGVAVTVAACGLLPLPSAPAAAEPPPRRSPEPRTIAYVTSGCVQGGGVKRLDPATNTVAGEIDTGGCTHVITLSPDGNLAYVATLANDKDYILVIGTDINQVIDRVEVPHFPQGMAVTPDGAQVYVTVHDFGPESNKVVVIDAHADIVSETIPIDGSPVPVAVDHEGRFALVGVSGAGKGASENVTVINTKTNAIARTIPLPAGPRAIAVHPSRHRAYVTGGGGKNGQVMVINPVNGHLLRSISVSQSPRAVAVSDDGTRTYVTLVSDQGGNALAVINTATNAVIATIEIPDYRTPIGVALSHDGKTAYVTTTTGKQDAVVVIDTAHKSVTATIDLHNSDLELAEIQDIAVGRRLFSRRPPGEPRPGKPIEPGTAGEPDGPATAADVLEAPLLPAPLAPRSSTGAVG
ncbi:YncE family protein [Nonomuraea sp. CA-141351]|uniref:YncE family protein n=1 Tax=Nonomuraea sp. CA-141351 TaxID=3239996 RepID=UPI003D90D3E6